MPVAAPSGAPMTGRASLTGLRRTLRRLHRILGLSIGLWAAVTALTGAVLVFGAEIDRWLNPNWLRVEPRAERVDIDVPLAAVRVSFPHAPVHSLRLPQTADEPLVVRLGERLRNVYVDPYSGAVLGVRDQYDGAVGWLRDFHVHLFAGEPGRTAVGVLAALLVFLIVIGMVLGWRSPAAPARAQNRRAPPTWTARLLRLHRIAGVLGGPLLLVSVVTGLMLVFHQASTTLLVRSLGGPAVPSAPTVKIATSAVRQSLETVIEAADAALPGARPTYVMMPTAPDAPIVVRQRFATNPHPNGRSSVAMDPYTGAVLQVHDWRHAGPGVRASDYKFPLHIGQAFGLTGRIATVAVGFLPLVLLASAGVSWWRRRRLRAARPGVAIGASAPLRDAA